MKNSLKDFLKWVRKHKKALIIAGISITAIIAIAFYNKDSINELWNYLRKRINEHPEDVKKATRAIKDCAKTVTCTAEKTIELNTDVITKRNYIYHCGSFPVSGGPVKLPQGWHPSPEKLELGKTMGLDFEALGITWRNDFIKGAA